MTRYLLDTNHLSEAIRRRTTLRYRLQHAQKSGHVFGTCVPALGELETGILQTHDPAEYRRRLRALLAILRVWPLDVTTARLFGEVHQELRGKGRVASQVDMFLAAMCRQMNLVLLSTDTDFDALPDIHHESWV